jgi:predicted dehydrogenase
MLAQADLDAVSICLPHHLHCDAAVAASEAGLHVLCEKPMTVSLEQCDAMIAAAEAAGKVLMVGQVLRFRNAARQARELLREGAVGEIKQVIRRRLGSFKEFPRAPWSRDPEQAGGWTLYGFGSHEGDQILWLTDSSPTSVFACGRTNNPYWSDTDELSILFGLSCGGFATELHSLNCAFGAWDCTIIGTEAAMQLGNDEIRIDERVIEGPMQASGGMTEQIREFGAAIREGREPEASGRDVRRTMVLLEAAKLSLQSGQMVDATKL